jgi:predicted phosphoribosyltransferase
MYFPDRLTLGKRLAGGITSIRGTDAIIVCLKNSSLLTCISMAQELRAWIYQLEFETIKNPMDETKILGAVTEEGEFVLSPTISEFELEEIQMEFADILEDRKRDAMGTLNRRGTKSYDKHVMNGRTVILTGDIMFDSLGIAITKAILKPLTPKNIVGVAGNVTVDVSDAFHMQTAETTILDVLPHGLFDDNHYFEKMDEYSDEEKRALALNIVNYWV